MAHWGTPEGEYHHARGHLSGAVAVIFKMGDPNIFRIQGVHTPPVTQACYIRTLNVIEV
jgi:hypothetical protein